MSKSILYVIFLSFIFSLVGCSNQRIQPYVGNDVLKETWMHRVITNPSRFIQNIDPWFLTGQSGPPQKNMSVLEIKSPALAKSNFTGVAVSGNFQVQIVGGQDSNSVFVYGPTEVNKLVSVNIFNNRLQIRQNEPNNDQIRNVIVRIGVRHPLNLLENRGNSVILGRGLQTENLIVSAMGGGSIYLDGKINLSSLEHRGSGTITILSVDSPKLRVNVIGTGNVNLYGRIGIENIIHKGNGVIHIVGADSDNLCITAAGDGITSIFGYVHLNEVLATDKSQVYVYWVYSKRVNVAAKNKAVVGLAGTAANLYVDISNQTCFLGEYMRSCNIYVKAKDNAHADVAADLKIFASSYNKSSIYYFGSPTILTHFSSPKSSILPLGNYLTPVCGDIPCTFTPPSFCGRVVEKVTSDPLF